MKEQIALKAGTVARLQEYIDAKIKARGFEDESLHERLILLSEEVGELMKACRKISGMNVDQKKENAHKVGEEITDIINMVFAVGIVLGLDIEKEYLQKEAEVDRRTYARSIHKI